MLENPNYATNALRYTNVDALEHDIEKSLMKRPTQEWLKMFEAVGIPCGPISTIADVATNPQVAARNMILSIPDAILGTLKVPGNPIKMVDIPERSHSSAPEVDADREKILALLKKPVEIK